MGWIRLVVNVCRNFFKNFSENRKYEKEISYLRKKVRNLDLQLKKRENSVEDAKTFFLKNLYHEIRTPLNSIIGFSDLIEMNHLNDKRTEYMTYIRESSRDFLRKMDNIVEASIVQAGLLKIEYGECKLYDVLAEIHSYYSLHKHITEKNIVFLLSVSRECKDLIVKSDSYRISQVLINMVSNSFKHTRQGVIELGFEIIDHELHFFVKDTGAGGLEGMQDKVFRNFAKVDETDDSCDGLGLGLSLSKNIVELMGGEIWYDSVKDKGTQFYFTLPYTPINTSINNKPKQVTETLVDMKESLRRSAV